MLGRMRDAYRQIALPNDDAHIALLDWGRTIKAEFDANNLHLSGRETHSMTEKAIAVVHQLGSTVGRMQAQMSELSSRVARFEEAHETSLLRIERNLGRLVSAGGATRSSWMPW